MELFSEIPRHNQLDVLKKMGFKEFVHLKQCSQETVELTKNFKHRLRLEMPLITFLDNGLLPTIEPFSFYQFHRFSEESVCFEVPKISILSPEMNGMLVEEFFSNAFIRAQKLFVTRNVVDSLTIFDFIERFHVKQLEIMDPSFAFTNLSVLQKLEELRLYNSEIEESTFLLLRATKITLSRTNLTLLSINKFFKQWMDGTRKIDDLRMQEFPNDNLEMFNGLEFSVHHTPEMPEVAVTDVRKLKNVYSLRRGDGMTLFIAIECNNSVYFVDEELLLVAREHENDDYNSWLRLTYPSCILCNCL